MQENAHLHVHTYTCMHLHAHTYTHSWMHRTHTCRLIHTPRTTCMQICTLACIHTHTHTHTHTCMYAHTHTHTHAHACTHTHAHTHTLSVSHTHTHTLRFCTIGISKEEQVFIQAVFLICQFLFLLFFCLFLENVESGICTIYVFCAFMHTIFMVYKLPCRPLPHVRYRPNWKPPGRPVYARDLLLFPVEQDSCQLGMPVCVFAVKQDSCQLGEPVCVFAVEWDSCQLGILCVCLLLDITAVH